MVTKSQSLKKEQPLSLLKETRRALLAEVTKLSEAEQGQVFLGIWSVRDLLAHLIGWDHTNRQAVKSILIGQIPAFYEHRDRDWQTYNAMLVKKYKRDLVKEMIATANDSQAQLIEFLQTIPAEHFNKDFGVRFRGYKVTIQRLIEAETNDEQTHCEQIVHFFEKVV